MKKCIYTRYNRERLSEFQIVTTIYTDGVTKSVMKKALTPMAQAHVQKIYKNFEQLQRHYPALQLVEVVDHGEDSIIFPYVQGSTLDHTLGQALLNHDATKFFQLLDQYKEFLFSFETITLPRYCNPWGGTLELTDVVSLAHANIDVTFDNIMLNKAGQYTVIDYEWVFEKIPLDFIMYRSIANFANKYHEYFDDTLSFDSMLNRLGLTSEKRSFYQKMEECFQAYVYGPKTLHKINASYRQPVVTLQELQQKAAYTDDSIARLAQQGYITPPNGEIFLANKEKQSHIADGRVMQLFVSSDQQFCEEQSICKSLDSQTNSYEFDVAWQVGISHIRFDPLNTPCIMRLEDIKAVDVHGQLVELVDGSTNADVIEGNIYYFSTNDPQIYFSVVPQELPVAVAKIRVTLTYLDVQQQGVLTILRHLNQLGAQQLVTMQQQLDQKDTYIQENIVQIHHRDVQILQRDAQIEELSARLQQREQQISEIINSRHYRLAGKMAGVYRTLTKKS